MSRAALHAGRRRWGPRPPRARARAAGPGAGPALVVGVAVVGLLAGGLAALTPPAADAGPLGSVTARWGAAVALLAAAVAVTLLTSRQVPGSAAVRLVGAPALAATAGLVVPLAASPARVSVSIVLAAALAAVVTALASSDGSAAGRGERTATACLGGLAVLVAASVLWGRPLAAAAAVVVGLAPVLVRALPSASLDVDSTQLLDTDRLSTTVWSVRERHASRRRRVTETDVRDRVAQARSVVSVGTAYLAVLAAGAGWLVALSPALSSLAPWSRWVVLLVSALALGYPSRHVRDRLARFSMLAAAASLTASASVAVVGWDTGWFWPVIGAALTLGIVAVLAAVALAGGWASTRMSRSADRLESLAVVTALPLGVLAAGAVEALRRLTSG